MPGYGVPEKSIHYVHTELMVRKFVLPGSEANLASSVWKRNDQWRQDWLTTTEGLTDKRSFADPPVTQSPSCIMTQRFPTQEGSGAQEGKAQGLVG